MYYFYGLPEELPTDTTTGGARIRQRFNRSLLAYPAGAVPGVDWAHTAAGGLEFSAVANANGFVSILEGKQGAKAGSPTGGMDSNIGAVATFGSGSTPAYNFANMSTAKDTNFTIGVIFKLNSVGNFNSLFCTDASGQGGVSLGFDASGNLRYNYNNWVSNAITFFPTLSTGVPYFVAFSTAGAVEHGILINLRTGQSYTGTATPAGIGYAANTPNGSFQVGNNGTSLGAGSSIAAVMYSTRKMVTSQLQVWGSDPWSFWYPRQTINLTSTAASVGASFLPVWAFDYNLSVLGTGTF